MAMSGRERALRALNFERVDRVPMMAGWAPHAEFLIAASGDAGFWDHPSATAIRAWRNLECDMCPQLVLPNKREDFRGDVRATWEARQAYSSPEDVVRFVESLPTPEQARRDYNYEKAYGDYVAGMRANQDLWGDMLWLNGFGHPGFMHYSTFGYENYYMALALYPDEMEKLYALEAEQGRLFNDMLTRAIPENDLPPFTYGGQDICGEQGPMVSLQMLDRFYFPHLRRALAPLVEADIRTVWHCDGNIMPILNRLLEAGIDGFQGFQTETGVDLAHLARIRTRKGRKPILWGSISVTRTLPWGTVEDVKQEVEQVCDLLAPGGGFVLAPTSSICPEVPVGNVFAMFEHAKIYTSGKY
jgi:hypothetical protein